MELCKWYNYFIDYLLIYINVLCMVIILHFCNGLSGNQIYLLLLKFRNVFSLIFNYPTFNMILLNLNSF